MSWGFFGRTDTFDVVLPTANTSTLIESHMQRTAIMKTATFPSLRVEPELREAAESVLREGETLTSLIETAVRETIHRRRVQAEFLARGLKSSEDARRTGLYHSATAVHGELQRRLDARRKRVLG
ncbi:YlcI/YnfO family protein [Piscinibacter sp.]|uniref:YlcI/YnfO family protein n=1 Tax=Piscinibacter sp. TaxID=1903157 RepID=UPI002CDF4D04|nr:YlcI/YnfO family protein [Albitalea sp.]HUG22947.1 YlcI/YnfO family protein [Albitalea sp.]